MSNPTTPDDGSYASNSLTSGEYVYAHAEPVTGGFSLTEEGATPASSGPSTETDPANEAQEEVLETVDPGSKEHSVAGGGESMAEDLGTIETEEIMDEMAVEAFIPSVPAVPADFASSPWADLSFLATPGPMPMPSPELAESTQPPPAAAVSPTAGSSPDVHPTEMPETPVTTGVSEMASGEAQDAHNPAGPVNVEMPAPAAIETPPAPVSTPPAPAAAEPNIAAGELPSGAAAPTGAAGTAPVNLDSQDPAAIEMQMQMSENTAQHMAKILQDILQSESP